MEPGIEIEDLCTGAETMIRCEEDGGLWAGHGNRFSYESVELSEVIKTEIVYALFPG
jgi:hypothetical protein